MRSLPLLVSILAVPIAVLGSSLTRARAATLEVSAPESCVELTTLNEEVEALIGRSLTEIPHVAFRLTVVHTAPAGARPWHLRLEAEESGPALTAPKVHVRELEGASCSELAEAAAVAMAVSVRTLEETPAPRASEKPVAGTREPLVLSRATPEVRAAPPWRPAVALSLLGDAGEVPGAGLGVMLSGLLGRGPVRGRLALGWVPPRDGLAAGGRGGRFQLGYGALDACLVPERPSWTFLACGGLELGLYGAEGIGVARPSSRVASWRAARVAAGARLSLGPSVAVAPELVVLVPWARPSFVLDEAIAVYRPSALAVRLAVSVEYSF